MHSYLRGLNQSYYSHFTNERTLSSYGDLFTLSRSTREHVCYLKNRRMKYQSAGEFFCSWPCASSGRFSIWISFLLYIIRRKVHCQVLKMTMIKIIWGSHCLFFVYTWTYMKLWRTNFQKPIISDLGYFRVQAILTRIVDCFILYPRKNSCAMVELSFCLVLCNIDVLASTGCKCSHWILTYLSKRHLRHLSRGSCYLSTNYLSIVFSSPPNSVKSVSIYHLHCTDGKGRLAE